MLVHFVDVSLDTAVNVLCMDVLQHHENGFVQMSPASLGNMKVNINLPQLLRNAKHLLRLLQ